MCQVLLSKASSSPEAGSTERSILIGRGARYLDGTSLLLHSELPQPNVKASPFPVTSGHILRVLPCEQSCPPAMMFLLYPALPHMPSRNSEGFRASDTLLRRLSFLPDTPRPLSPGSEVCKLCYLT